jgi:hypothetical protein
MTALFAAGDCSPNLQHVLLVGVVKELVKLNFESNKKKVDPKLSPSQLQSTKK